MTLIRSVTWFAGFEGAILQTLFNINPRALTVGDKHDPTVRLKKKPNVISDDRGRRVWAALVEPAEFELVSTMELQKILDSDNDARQQTTTTI